MAYEKQNFTDGQTLNAEHLTRIEDGIIAVEETVDGIIDDTDVDTQAWSSKHTIDRLCPGFTESGSAVVCEPVDGYPLEVVSTLDATDDGYASINLYHGGKNLIPKTEPGTHTKNGTTFVLNSDGSVTISGTPTTNTTFNLAEFVPSSYLRGKQLVVNNNVGESVYLAIHLFCDDNTDNWNWLRGNRADSLTKVAPNNTKSITPSIIVLTTFDGDPVTFYPQLEFGAVDTEYEGPRDTRLLTVDLSGFAVAGGSYNWTTGVLIDENGREIMVTQHGIYAHEGINTFASDCGSTQVTGKADPVAIIDKLTNAIIALGGNV